MANHALAEPRRSLTSKSWIKVPRSQSISEDVRENDDNCGVLSDEEVQDAARCEWHCFSPTLDPPNAMILGSNPVPTGQPLRVTAKVVLCVMCSCPSLAASIKEASCSELGCPLQRRLSFLAGLLAASIIQILISVNSKAIAITSSNCYRFGHGERWVCC